MEFAISQPKWSDCHRIKSKHIDWKLGLNVIMGFDLGHDLDLEYSRSNIKFAISQKKWSDCHESKANILIELKASNEAIRFDLGHDLYLWIFKVKCDLHLRAHTWPWPWIAVISEWEGWLTFNKGDGSRSFMTRAVTIWWSRSGVRICQILTWVTLDVIVPSTHLVYTYNGNYRGWRYFF